MSQSILTPLWSDTTPNHILLSTSQASSTWKWMKSGFLYSIKPNVRNFEWHCKLFFFFNVFNNLLLRSNWKVRQHPFYKISMYAGWEIYIVVLSQNNIEKHSFARILTLDYHYILHIWYFTYRRWGFILDKKWWRNKYSILRQKMFSCHF